MIAAGLPLSLSTRPQPARWERARAPGRERRPRAGRHLSRWTRTRLIRAPPSSRRARGSYPNDRLVGYRTIDLPAPLSRRMPSRRSCSRRSTRPPARRSRASTGSSRGGGAVDHVVPVRGARLRSRSGLRARTNAARLRAARGALPGDGFTYDENPPRRPYPLESFLFQDKVGYCQQFSGAMALLLRMGGIPARVLGGVHLG